jgi:segregation and condensation protein B
MPELRHIIESLLFASDQPISEEALLEALPGTAPGQLRAALVEINLDYEARGGGFRLAQVAGGWQLRTRPEFAPWIRRLHRAQPARLSRAALETLAIIAYKQPVMRSEIEHIRGVDAGGVLRQLMEKDLVRVLGRKDIPGRPMVYATTRRFLEVFELKDLAELPSLKEIEDLGFETPKGAEAKWQGRTEEEGRGVPEDAGQGVSGAGGVETESEPEAPEEGEGASGADLGDGEEQESRESYLRETEDSVPLTGSVDLAGAFAGAASHVREEEEGD